MNRPTTSDTRYRIIDADWSRHETSIREIRNAVFVQEQAIPADLEWDGSDPDCIHALALLTDGRAVATGRLQQDGRLGRMCVLADWRGRGIGRAILEHLLARARELNLSRVHLHAQEGVYGFYEKSGFSVQGEPFTAAGIPHREMSRVLE